MRFVNPLPLLFGLSTLLATLPAWALPTDRDQPSRVQADSAELSFFASYNGEGVGPFPVQFDRIEQFSRPYISDHHIELIQPVRLDKQIIGYVYVRANQDELSKVILASGWKTCEYRDLTGGIVALHRATK